MKPQNIKEYFYRTDSDSGNFASIENIETIFKKLKKEYDIEKKIEDGGFLWVENIKTGERLSTGKTF